MTTEPRFIHLRLHTEHSLLQGAIRTKKLPGLAAAMAMPAVAVTDTNAMFGALEFSVTAAGAGIQPIIGCQLDLAWEKAEQGQKPTPPAPLVLLAQDKAGYDNLLKLNSCLYLRGDGALPHVTPELRARAPGAAGSTSMTLPSLLRPRTASTSSVPRSSIGISAPASSVQSMVECGIAT